MWARSHSAGSLNPCFGPAANASRGTASTSLRVLITDYCAHVALSLPVLNEAQGQSVASALLPSPSAEFRPVLAAA